MAVCQNCGNNVCRNGKIWIEKEGVVFVFCKACRLKVKIPVEHGRAYLFAFMAANITDWIGLN